MAQRIENISLVQNAIQDLLQPRNLPARDEAIEIALQRFIWIKSEIRSYKMFKSERIVDWIPISRAIPGVHPAKANFQFPSNHWVEDSDPKATAAISGIGRAHKKGCSRAKTE